jgi:hypothetical protein
MLLQELSQILETTNITSSQEEKILIAVKNICSSQKGIVDQNFHEKQQDLEVSIEYPDHLEEELKELWTPLDEEKNLEPEIEAFLACLDALCIK